MSNTGQSASQLRIRELEEQLAAKSMSSRSTHSGPSASQLRIRELEEQLAAKSMSSRSTHSGPSASQLRIRELEEQLASKLKLASKLNKMEAREVQLGIEREEEIKTLLIKSFQLDIAFLVDVTGSMQGPIDMVQEKISHILDQILAEKKGTKIRVGFVGYRDYGEKVEQYDFQQVSEGRDSLF
ncbi:hypothetical protein CEUSTIGMA_g6683.t1 [Chlamydomonas eustigma]|uniref:VWFA domain-containing protein n=1 Tax=Chlamydomonas eustigma TaxID=1157962 RepID=A0A250X843_9CHLO|nr:hypothetical protein CEUSTIGMA_g6683.t1 [Chlamydomonas eustigma]|eukprot:GAX79243.1 hypothetical protein CEUSTIGMA_g6683.t1 [Chlamydomonas eustigma]